jgi:hypothetical protein
LDSEEWRQALSYRFMKNGITYHDKNMPKVDVMNVLPATSKDSTLGKGCDYVAKCKYEEVTFDFPIYIPKKIKETNISIDTVHNQYRKTVWSKYSSKGVTGIYIRDLKGFEPSMNSYLALSMTTTNLTKTQQEIALKIFKTARHKSGSK